MRGKPSNAVFTPVGNATFDLVNPEATFDPVNSDDWTKKELDEVFLDTPEDRFLRGEVLYVGAASSNVESFRFEYFYPDGMPRNQLYVIYKDGSEYEYDGISMSEALLFFRAASPGGVCWDQLRIRGTVFGYKKTYRLVSGSRVWKSTNSSIARHSEIPPSGEPFAGYHPATNFSGASGKLGMPGLNLSKKRGSKKIAYFTPSHDPVR